ncbi:hypothetical protein [Bathymodiolus thermophilus thioautotrophic gill symbiont]|uniref:hypothetical protein n=1 Tax=Bathymodiolus thermophilus thioautotrophic gill symbiont TaxID=2360 RepID=UPI0015D62B42|nr:hypothetical protein [Bathymodiolus thermophilus thioautotrophic gill symbiont]
MNSHQKSTFQLLGSFSNSVLVSSKQGWRKLLIWQKLNFAHCPYLHLHQGFL